MSKNIVGIDLGTTFSALAVLNSIGKPEVVPNKDGYRLTPSAVYFPEEDPDKTLVGLEALNARRGSPKRVARWIKRCMGESEYPEDVAGRKWSPAELSSFILTKLKNDCFQQVGEIEDVVITVPAHFDEVRRKATMDAGKMAGLNVVGIVNEPTAAALFYAATKNVSGRILVFDLGGGTFDVTVMDVIGQKVNIICSQGDHKLGGCDFDRKVLEMFERAYKDKFGRSLIVLDTDKADYEDKAEDAKKILSKAPTVQQMLAGEEGRTPCKITREAFEEAMSPYMARIDMLVETALDEAKMKASDANQVLFVGGSTRIPLVRQRVEKMFGFAPTTTVNVDEAVALGAALHAGLILMETEPSRVPKGIVAGLRDIENNDVANGSYGTICLSVDEETGDSVLINDPLIQKNSSLPCEVTKTYYTAVDGQETIEANVTEGEEDDPENAKRIATGEMSLPPGRPAGRPVRVTYSYDRNQRMHCVFEDVESGEILTMDIDTQSGGVSQEDVSRSRSVLEQFQVE